MSDVNVDPGDGTVTTDPSTGTSGGLNITQTVNQAQNQDQAQQQQQQQGPTPVVVTLVVAGQVQTQGTPSVLIPLSTHVQAQGLLAQLQTLLGL